MKLHKQSRLISLAALLALAGGWAWDSHDPSDRAEGPSAWARHKLLAQEPEENSRLRSSAPEVAPRTPADSIGRGFRQAEVATLPCFPAPSATPVGLDPASRPLNLYRGRLMATDFSPIPGAEILYVDQTGNIRTTRSEGDGNFVLGDPQVKNGLLRFEAEGFGCTFQSLQESPRNSPLLPPVYVLKRSASLSGQILSPNGQPAQNFFVRITEEFPFPLSSKKQLAPPPLQAQTDLYGKFHLAEIPANRKLRMTVFGNGIVEELPQTYVLPPGAHEICNWHLGQSTIIHGQVVDNFGVAVPDVTIELRPSSLPQSAIPGSIHSLSGMPSGKALRTRCNAQGYFEFPKVLPGRWLVGAATYPRPHSTPGDFQDFFVSPTAVLVEVLVGTGPIHVALPVQRGQWILGKLLNEDGLPIPHAEIRAHHLRSPARRRVLSTAGGQFALGPLPPGEYKLHTSLPVHSELTHLVVAPRLIRAGTAPVTLHAVSGVEISGQLEDIRKTLSNRLVRLTSLDQPLTSLWSELEFHENGFKSERVPPGEYSLFAELEDGRIIWLPNLQLDAQTNWTDLVPMEGGRLNVQSLLQDLSEEADYSIRAFALNQESGAKMVVSQPFVPGQAKNMILPEGRMQVELWQGNKVMSRRWVTIQAMAAANLDF